MAGTIAVIGSINTDLVTFTDRVPDGGETLSARDFAVLPGGKGANQAVAAVRLGGRVELVGRVGDDAFGRDRRQELADAGVGIGGVRVTEAAPSGVATILVESSGENRILIVSGANGRVTMDDIDPVLLETAALIVLQLEIRIETVYAVIAAAKAPVLLNPAPAVPIDIGRLRGLAFLVPNQTELALLTGLPTQRMDDVVVAARRLVRQGIGTVIATLGADGAMLVTSARVAHVECPSVKPVDSTGAGDAFIGCFAQTYVETGDIDTAMARAVRYASLSVMRRGAQGSYPDAAAFARLMPVPGAGG